MSDFWISKMRTYFRVFDYDKDGVLTRNDFAGMADRFCDMENADPVQKETVRQRLMELFTLCTKAAGTSDDVLLTEDLVIESVKMQRDDLALKKAVSDLMLSLFTVMDLNHDGYLQFGEFRRYFENGGVVDSNFTKKAFDAIDVNHDGKLSFEEFINSAIDYMCSDDENTGAFLGLLV